MKLCAFVTGHRVIPPTRYNWRGTGKLLVAARSERCNTDEISWTKVGGHHRLTDTTSLTLTPSHPHTAIARSCGMLGVRSRRTPTWTRRTFTYPG